VIDPGCNHDLIAARRCQGSGVRQSAEMLFERTPALSHQPEKGSRPGADDHFGEGGIVLSPDIRTVPKQLSYSLQDISTACPYSGSRIIESPFPGNSLRVAPALLLP